MTDPLDLDAIERKCIEAIKREHADLKMAWALPGDGTLEAIRQDHEKDRNRNNDPKAVKPNPYTFAQVEFLLDVIEGLGGKL